MSHTQFKGLIFDFNGVLWWDSHLQERSWKQFSAHIRGTSFSNQEIQVHVHGRNNSYSMAYLAGRDLTPQETHNMIQQKENAYRQMCLAEGAGFALSPGAEKLLDSLASEHILRTIATASEKTNLAFFFQHLHLARWFDDQMVVYDNGSRPGKPAPDIYLQAADNLGLAAADCLVVEDSLSGIQAAHAAGIGQIIALGPASTHPQLATLPGVDQVITSLAELDPEKLFYGR